EFTRRYARDTRRAFSVNTAPPPVAPPACRSTSGCPTSDSARVIQSSACRYPMPNSRAAARIEPWTAMPSRSWMNRGPMILSPSRRTMSTARARAPSRHRMLLPQGRTWRSEVGDELEVGFIDRMRWTLGFDHPVRHETQILLGRDEVHAEGRPPLPRVRVRAVRLPRVVEPLALEDGLQPRQDLVRRQHVAAAGVLVRAAQRPRSVNPLAFHQHVPPLDATVVPPDVVGILVAQLGRQRQPRDRRHGDAPDQHLEPIGV